MGPPLDPLNLQPPDREIPLSGVGVIARLYELTDERGSKQVGIWLQRSYETRAGQTETLVFVSDIDRLEAVVRHGNELKAKPRAQEELDPRAPISLLDHGTWTARFYERQDPRGDQQIVVTLDQENQRFSCDLARLADVVKGTKEFEKERGHERTCYPIVKLHSLTENEDRVRVTVVRWVSRQDVKQWGTRGEITQSDIREEAQKRADSNWKVHGYAIHDIAYRRPLGGAGYTLTVNGAEIPKLAPDIRHLEAERDRVGPGLLLGVWHHKGQTPYPGMPVQVLGGQDLASREPTDYRIIPAGVQKPDGVNEKPLGIIVDTDNRTEKGHPRVRAVVPGLREAQARFHELKAEALEQERQRQIKQQAEPEPKLPRRPR